MEHFAVGAVVGGEDLDHDWGRGTAQRLGLIDFGGSRQAGQQRENGYGQEFHIDIVSYPSRYSPNTARNRSEISPTVVYASAASRIGGIRLAPSRAACSKIGR